MTQNTVGESNPNIRLQVGFQILNHASKWIQDWSKQLVFGSDSKMKCSLGKDNLSQGWWCHLFHHPMCMPTSIQTHLPAYFKLTDYARRKDD